MQDKNVFSFEYFIQSPSRTYTGNITFILEMLGLGRFDCIDFCRS